ncbi:MAG: MoaD/ThiS family protein [Thermoleophilia bacterium]|nr:MoaD/ThiS family protein [Thermoleophilia bacterium]
MKIVVRTIGPLRQVLGGAQMEVVLNEGATIKTLLTRLAQLHGADFARYLAWLGEGDNRAGANRAYAPLRVLLRGRDVLPSQYEQTELSDGDEVLVFTPVAGG